MNCELTDFLLQGRPPWINGFFQSKLINCGLMDFAEQINGLSFLVELPGLVNDEGIRDGHGIRDR